ncbi:MAG: polyprenyl diphosphate synthase, partial [Candidatus Parcubacteria bacterium]|nr:polyprenyl diphosphate synthase [Candidatus Parcubacteria bacterium]
ILNICFNYGGRQEILEAVKKIIKRKIPVNKLNAELFRKYLFHDLPDPDIIMRTSGEQRLSNFLTWQSVYSELIFLKKHWPDFSEKDLKQIINIYKKRQRRFGQ